MLSKFLKYLSLYNRKKKYKKISYSFNAVDLIIDYLFKNKKKGFYIDIGAQHPISNNNTYLLFKKGFKFHPLHSPKDIVANDFFYLCFVNFLQRRWRK